MTVPVNHRCPRDHDPATGDEWLCLVCGRRAPVGPFVPLRLVTRLTADQIRTRPGGTDATLVKGACRVPQTPIPTGD